MNHEARVFAELVAANPSPAGQEPSASIWPAVALLEEVDRRSGDPLADQQAVDRPAMPARNWLVAVAAFVIVLIGVGLVSLIARGPDRSFVDPTPTTSLLSTTEVPSTTQGATTTTTATPSTTLPTPVDSADQAAIDAFIAAMNSGDPEVIRAVLAPDARVWATLIASNDDPIRIDEFADLFDSWLAFSRATRMHLALNTCTSGGERIACRGTLSDLIVDAGPLPPASLFATFEVDESGLISLASLKENEPSMQAAYSLFTAWLDKTYPGESDLVWDGAGRPRFSRAELWGQRALEYFESRQ